MFRREKINENFFKTANFVILLSLALNFSFPQISLAHATENKENRVEILKAVPIEKNLNEDVQKNVSMVKYAKYVTLTAYSSTVDQCDDTPFITANGTHVHDGTIAANFLKFGTKVKIPDYFGDKIFIVEDRTHPRYGDRVDIWMETRQQALNFGIRNLKIEVLE